MTYLLTNATALTALQNLTMTQNALSNTQNQLSTGLSVANASDNASYWSIATTMSSDNGALSAVQSSLGASASMLSNFNSAVNQAISVVNLIKNDLTAAQNPGADLTQINNDIVAQQNSLLQITSGASFNGQNWLNGSVATGTAITTAATSSSLVGSYTNNGGVSYISVTTSNVNLMTAYGTAVSSAATATGGILGGTSITLGAYSVLGTNSVTIAAATAQSTIATMLTAANLTVTALEAAATTLGQAQNQVTTQQTFTTTMQNNLSNGVAALVDANMNQVSTRLQALQTQQQLGVQSLSIANQSSSEILKLFQ